MFFFLFLLAVVLFWGSTPQKPSMRYLPRVSCLGRLINPPFSGQDSGYLPSLVGNRVVPTSRPTRPCSPRQQPPGIQLTAGMPQYTSATSAHSSAPGDVDPLIHDRIRNELLGRPACLVVASGKYLSKPGIYNLSPECQRFKTDVVKLLSACKLALSELPHGHCFWKSGDSVEIVDYVELRGGRVWLFRGYPGSKEVDRDDILAHLRHNSASQ
jgi:hypothetical protein